jgi:hypothetical protein
VLVPRPGVPSAGRVAGAGRVTEADVAGRLEPVVEEPARGDSGNICELPIATVATTAAPASALPASAPAVTLPATADVMPPP